MVDFRKENHDMQEISKEYLLLFNAVTDAEEALQRLQVRLMRAQQAAEELYLDKEESAEGERSA
jgi:hypothetical protein